MSVRYPPADPPHDRDLAGIGVEQLSPPRVHPHERVFQVFDDGRQLRLRRETIVDRYDHVARLEHHL